MSEELLNLQFEMLNRRIGEEVSCKVWQAGEEVIYTGILNGVYPFDSISVDSQVISFVGTTHAIEEVILKRQNKTIYTNPLVKGYKGFTAKDVMGLVNAQNDLLGRSIIMEGMQKRDEGRKHR